MYFFMKKAKFATVNGRLNICKINLVNPVSKALWNHYAKVKMGGKPQ